MNGLSVRVAIEHIEGSLAGTSGSFVLQHVGIMDRGTASLRVEIIPDSGTANLVGISGTIHIDVAPDGTHTYTLEYETRS